MRAEPTLRYSKPPYLLGLLCLIPLVGAFVGLGLLLYGVIRYKDIWLSIIGGCGILLTITVYWFAGYYLKHSEVAKHEYRIISQTELNKLIKNVEFYKLQHGHYPDGLRDLLKDDQLAPIYDIVQKNQGRKDRYYQYKNLGTTYVLFSSGEDGIPNTSDDFYPEIINGDSSKIGLVRPN